MADFTTILKDTVEVHTGQRGYRQMRFVASFNSTDASCTLPVPDISQIDNVQVTIASTPASDEVVYWADTVSTSGPTPRPASGKITIARTGASKTSALKICVLVFGR